MRESQFFPMRPSEKREFIIIIAVLAAALAVMLFARETILLALLAFVAGIGLPLTLFYSVKRNWRGEATEAATDGPAGEKARATASASTSGG